MICPVHGQTSDRFDWDRPDSSDHWDNYPPSAQAQAVGTCAVIDDHAIPGLQAICGNLVIEAA